MNSLLEYALDIIGYNEEDKNKLRKEYELFSNKFDNKLNEKLEKEKLFENWKINVAELFILKSDDILIQDIDDDSLSENFEKNIKPEDFVKDEIEKRNIIYL